MASFSSDRGPAGRGVESVTPRPARGAAGCLPVPDGLPTTAYTRSLSEAGTPTPAHFPPHYQLYRTAHLLKHFKMSIKALWNDLLL